MEFEELSELGDISISSMQLFEKTVYYIKNILIKYNTCCF